MAKNQGIKSRNVVRKPMRQGAPRERVHIPGTNQLGAKAGDHVTEKRGSTGFTGHDLITGTGFPSELGNKIAEETVCGPGGSRKVLGAGSQGTHGATAAGSPMSVGKEDLTSLGWKRRA